MRPDRAPGGMDLGITGWRSFGRTVARGEGDVEDAYHGL